MIRAVAAAGPASSAGLPMLAGSSTVVTKFRLNMYGWYCSAASSSHIRPSAICRPRRRPAASGSAAQASAGPVAAGRRSVACDEGGRNKVAKAAAEPPAATHRPGPPRATTMESPPSTLMLPGELDEQVRGETEGAAPGDADQPAGRLPAADQVPDPGRVR